MFMRAIEQITHTADKGIRIEADRLDELFLGALEGMMQIQKEEVPDTGDSTVKSVELESPDRTALLIDFLSEVLTLSHIHRALFTEADFERLSNRRLKGTIKGIITDRFDEDIKAVTHSQADIRERDDGMLETVVVFDI